MNIEEKRSIYVPAAHLSKVCFIPAKIWPKLVDILRKMKQNSPHMIGLGYFVESSGHGQQHYTAK